MLTKKLAALAAVLMLSGLSACADDRPSDNGDVEGVDESGGTTCDFVEDGAPPAKEVDVPPSVTDLSGDVSVVVETNVGDIPLTLDADKAPCTVASFVSLAEQDYYDDAPCHRLAASPGFEFLQCGDPTATGTGGPGYTIPDELTGDEAYDEGVLAMANSGFENSGDGQFFMVFGDTQLDGPKYTIFGTIEPEGIEVLQGIGAKGTSDPSGVGAPTEEVVFEDVVVS